MHKDVLDLLSPSRVEFPERSPTKFKRHGHVEENNNRRYTLSDGLKKEDNSRLTNSDLSNLYTVIPDSSITVDEFGNERICFVDPDREFNTYEYWIDNTVSYLGEIHYIPHYEESYGAKDLLITFYLAEMMNFKVVTYGCKNLVPLFSLISHECVLLDEEKLYEGVEEGKIGSKRWHNEQLSFVGTRSHTNTWDIHSHPNSQLAILDDYNNELQKSHDFFGLGITQKHIVWPHMFFVYGSDWVGINRYPYYELVMQSQYHPTDDELVEFYKNRPAFILQSSYDYCNELFDSEFWEEGKTEWFEHKSAMVMDADLQKWVEENPGIKLMDHPTNCLSNGMLKIPHFRDNHIPSTLNQNMKPLQTELVGGNFMGDSYLSMQILSSLTKNVRFNSCGGSSNFLSSVPHINCHTMYGWDIMLKVNQSFKKKINYEIFGQDVFISPSGAHDTNGIDLYNEWLGDG